ncbi:hypothetical protein C0Z01_21335 [Photobacterium kishitanii]|uniref:Uncharacterized protein n=1 Tax=Photobacterium kishitanii TaxID=318456 RepID=A0A0B7JDV4_9GAMM|nr:hypothetical protein [Photobacterium kishitanii]OBU23830.1 hypothetical protein AYY22_05680 [Photobacterium kishitanii]PSU91808.1 hypothetical protein C0W42_03890 [Photobacterium kishitanii]PSU92505.1 hypothetical protein C9J27_22200 [Photobacterium kishitanii]PSU93041.1 hypothetical protein C0W35_13545 [Photobacterium kishitanii]PSV20312.1 hypothetical protein C0W28_09320 [Photobacterium kishitanii]
MPITDEACEHSELLNALISRQSLLSTNRMQYIVYAAALACQNKNVLQMIQHLVGDVTINQRQDIHHAVVRMAATNAYYMAMHSVDLNCNVTNAMQLAPLKELDVEDKTSYYYACIAACLVNKGYSCLNNHITLLRSCDESDDSINMALRLTASVLTMCQSSFNNECFS